MSKSITYNGLDDYITVDSIDIGTTLSPGPSAITGGAINSSSSGVFQIDTSSLNWSTLNSNTYNITGALDIGSPIDHQLHVNGDATIDGDTSITGNLCVGGLDIGDSLRRIERRLDILRHNSRLESEWNELRELGDRYRELEAKLLDGENILKILGSKT